MRRAVAGMGVVLVAGLLAGCGLPFVTAPGGSMPIAAPTSTAPVRPSALFDPCTDIPDEALEAVGVDVESEYMSIYGNPKISGEHWDDHRECAWRGEDHRIWIASEMLPLDEVLLQSGITGVTEVVINRRSGIRYNHESCGAFLCAEIVFPTGEGTVWVNLRLAPRADPSLHANEEVIRYTTILEPYLPAR
ncbi:DUF3558 domain-containing protein [Lolliginicoccus suaedae]|uniref:DUF3558 domain-containing protein n=1 Tax=Lolliginicoccus suaedae TaxID=2605429 RepID=UPI0011EF7528|nr:DUF3558 domain-containing protein [Lolliginicoccus suaedae]